MSGSKKNSNKNLNTVFRFGKHKTLAYQKLDPKVCTNSSSIINWREFK